MKKCKKCFWNGQCYIQLSRKVGITCPSFVTIQRMKNRMKGGNGNANIQNSRYNATRIGAGI